MSVHTCTTARFPITKSKDVSNLFGHSLMTSTAAQRAGELTSGLQDLTRTLRAIGQRQGHNLIVTGELDLSRTSSY